MSIEKLLDGYKIFKDKYVLKEPFRIQYLANCGQHPKIMVVACSDSRVDPALIFQSKPGDLFVVRNVANIIPPYKNNNKYCSTSAALEFGICYLKVEHLILLGHSKCGGISTLINKKLYENNHFIKHWMSNVKKPDYPYNNLDAASKNSMHQSWNNCLEFPWIKQRVDCKKLKIHLWFFNIYNGEITFFDSISKQYISLL